LWRAWRIFHRVRQRTAGLTVTEVDPSDAAAVAVVITPLTKMIWVETQDLIRNLDHALEAARTTEVALA
jgi:cystathionine gamma-lyase